MKPNAKRRPAIVKTDAMAVRRWIVGSCAVRWEFTMCTLKNSTQVRARRSHRPKSPVEFGENCGMTRIVATGLDLVLRPGSGHACAAQGGAGCRGAASRQQVFVFLCAKTNGRNDCARSYFLIG